MLHSATLQGILGRFFPLPQPSVEDRPHAVEENQVAVERAVAPPFRIHIQRGVSGPVGVITLTDRLDRRTYAGFIDKVRELWDGGVTRLVVDVSNVRQFGLCCSYALHAAVRIAAGKSVPSDDLGWRGLRRLCEANLDDGIQANIVLVCGDERLPDQFSIAGMDEVFPVYGSLEQALAA